METPLIVNNKNTVLFKDDMEYLLFTLMNLEATMERHTDKFYFKHLIWANDRGFWLTFQAYNLKTNIPCGQIYSDN